MTKSELQRLAKVESRLYQLAEEAGLKFHEIEWDIIPDQKMFEIMAYRIPGNISNWKYGRDWERIRTINEQYMDGLPYEVVINSDPSRAYLMKSNTFGVQCLVMAHVIGHVSFFTMNKYFMNTRKDMIQVLDTAAKRFNEYEKNFGIEELEKTIDAAHSIQFHSSPFDKESEIIKKERVFEMLKRRNQASKAEYHDILDGLVDEKEVKDINLFNQRLWRRIKQKTPVEPAADLLRYIIDYSTVLEDWQRDVCEILRLEGQYFWPQMKTKYMNEGWACIVPTSLVITENGFVPIEQAVQHCNKVVGLENKLVDIDKRCVTEKISTIKIKTNIGIEIEGAELHRILINKNDNKEDVHLKDLKIGDTPYISVGLNIWPENIIKINIDSALIRQRFNRTQKVKIPNIINEDIAYFLGALTAEGTNLGRGFQFTNQNDNYLKTIKKIIENEFEKKAEIKPRKGKEITKDITIYSTPIQDFLLQSGLKNTKSEGKEIPWSILQSPKNIVSKYIAGLFDGDGCVYYKGKHHRNVIFTSKSEKLIRQIAIVLLNYGIVGSFSISKKEGYEDCYQLVISKGNCLKIFCDEIPFEDKTKRQLLEESINSLKWCYPVENICKITEIEHGESINYDWYIPDGNHYVAQGFINHNTYWHETLMKQLFDEGTLTTEEFDQFNHSNSLVKASNPKAMNPYLIGCKMWQDIEERWNKGRHGADYEDCQFRAEKKDWDMKEGKGREKMFEIMKSETDWFFVMNYLTADLVDKLNLYIYVLQETPESYDLVRTNHTAKQVRDLIIQSFAHSHIPNIELININHEDSGKFLMIHRHVGADLDVKYTEETMKHIRHLWGREVILDTIVNKKDTRFVCDKDKITRIDTTIAEKEKIEEPKKS